MAISIYPTPSSGIVKSITYAVNAAPSGTLDYDTSLGNVWVYSQNATADFAINFRTSSTSAFSTSIDIGETKTFLLVYPCSPSSYQMYQIKIDGVVQSFTRPSASIGIPAAYSTVTYAITIRKTGTSSYSVFFERTDYLGIASVSVTGGTVTSDATYYYATFTSSGTFTVENGPLSVDYLAIAGGGGGGRGNGSYGGGGAGAGGAVYATNQTLQPAAYSLSIGGGGSAGTSVNFPGGTGGNSTAFGATAIGGGGGASQSSNGAAGGCGGGASGNTLSGGTGTTGQGSRGGNTTGMSGAGSNQAAAAPGGGIGGSGKDITTADGNSSTNGGAGLTLLGLTLGGGGGGGGNGTSTAIAGGGIGTGGGTAGGNATANTGGGGGGGGYQSSAGGIGGSGVVRVRWTRVSVGG